MSQFNIDRIRNETHLSSIDFQPELDSTNSYAIGLIQQATQIDRELPFPLLILTDRQTAGRGQLNRTWHSSNGSLTLTICIHSPPEEMITILPLVIGLSVCEAIGKVCQPIEPELKWPNDIMLDDRKLGGVLVERIALNRKSENASSNSNLQYCSVIGIGINVNNCIPLKEPELSSQSGNLMGVPPISLKEKIGESTDLTDLTIALVHEVLANFNAIKLQHQQLILKCHHRMMFRDRLVTMVLPSSNTIKGKYAGLGDLGELLIDDGSEVQKIVSARDIRWMSYEKTE
jgi:BirA family biotin operon repressor/biotin-[acetyl-CoA-carboxylase] ligase